MDVLQFSVCSNQDLGRVHAVFRSSVDGSFTMHMRGSAWPWARAPETPNRALHKRRNLRVRIGGKSPSHIVAFWMTSCLSLGFQAILDELILVVPQCYTLPVGGCHSRSAGALLVFLCHAGSLFFVLVTASLCY